MPLAAPRSLLAAGALATVAAAAVAVFVHPLVAVALCLGVALAPLVLRSVDAAFLAVVAVIALLPFAALPLGIGFNPTLLDLVLGALYLIWVFRVVTREQATLRLPPLSALVGLLVGLMVVAFLAGLAQETPTKNQIRVFGELVLGAGLFFIVANLITDRASLRRVFVALVGCGAVAAAIGLALYVLPDGVEAQLLSLLRVVDYPAGPGVIRYINDDPTRLQRAVGTSIDPNSFGGLLAVLAALCAPQIGAARPIVPRRAAAAMTAVMALGVLATVSRGSLIGLAAGLALVGLFRDRRLLAVTLMAGAALVALAGVLPWTAAYVANFADGLRLEDRSTQMRLGEYRDALRLIGRYPLLGVGFGGVRDIDLYRGVSSLYLIVASTIGLAGLAAFLAALGAAALRMALAWRAMAADGLRAVVLGCLAALAAALVSGVFDHYFFTYPHAFALLWLIVGLAMGAIRLSGEEAGAAEP